MSKRKKIFLVAVDGPAGAGKSTVARALARALSFRYVDTGAMYRAAAWACRQAGVAVDAPRALRVAKTMTLEFRDKRLWVNGSDATHAIRTPEMSVSASHLALQPAMRKILVGRQRSMGKGGGVVMEGRDIGSIVFPKAPVKFYLDASVEERARRRWEELRARGERPRLSDIARSIEERDRRDRTRKISPLLAAADAVVVDTTGMGVVRVLATLLAWVKKKSPR